MPKLARPTCCITQCTSWQGRTLPSSWPCYFRFQFFTSGKFVSGHVVRAKRVATSQRIEREGLGKSRIGTRQSQTQTFSYHKQITPCVYVFRFSSENFPHSFQHFLFLLVRWKQNVVRGKRKVYSSRGQVEERATRFGQFLLVLDEWTTVKFLKFEHCELDQSEPNWHRKFLSRVLIG